MLVDWHGGRAGNNLADLPRGVQNLAGVEFDIRGLIQVFKDREEGLKWGFPERVNGVRIGRKLKRVHFLNGSCGGVVPDGTKIGSYVLHFDDGMQKGIPIIYGHDVRDWWKLPGEASEKTHSEIAWNGSNEASRKQGRSIRLFKSTWENEYPDVEIDTLDIVSNSEGAAPFLVAITAE